MNERTREMRKMYQSGKSLQEVADRYGITRQRVQQIFAENNIECRPRGGRRDEDYITEATKAKIVRHYMDGWDRKKIATTLGITQEAVRRVLRSKLTRDQMNERNREQASTRPAVRRWADWEMVAALQACADDIGNDFGVEKYTDWRDTQDDPLPSGPLFHTRRPSYAKGVKAASWNEWRRLAGLPVHERPGAAEWWSQFSPEDMYRSLDRVAVKVGHFPTIDEYEKGRRKTDATAGAIRRRHGSSWSKTRKAYAEWVRSAV